MTYEKLWDARIVEARERGSFTDTDKVNASDWTKCSVGEQRLRFQDNDVIKYDLDVDPVDMALTTLGLEFYDAVLANAVELAAEIHAKIVAHAEEMAIAKGVEI